jgi:hypothetical protein
MPTLQDGQNAIAEGNLQQARLIFEALLQENPRNEEAWLGLAEVLTDTEDRRICYENVLKINKKNQAAKEGLRNLEPQADPLVMALAPQQPEEPEEDEDLFDDDSTVISERSDFRPSPEEEQETPTAILVAVGLALSVVIFAIGGGAFYFLVSTLTGR